MEQEALSQWLKETCTHEGLSLREAAAKTGLSHTTIADIIKGARPSAAAVRKLAHAFGGNGQEKLALEDRLLILAGYRTQRPEGEEPSPELARLMDMVAGFSESRLKLMADFARFLAGVKKE